MLPWSTFNKKDKNNLKIKSDSLDTGRMLKAQETPTSFHWTSSERLMHTQPTSCALGVAQRHIDTYIHIKVYNKNNPSCKFRTLGTHGTKSHVQIVNNYQSLTIAAKNHTPGVTGFVDLLLNLIVIKNIFNWKFARSQFVGGNFTKFARDSSQESNFWFLTWKTQGIYIV